MDRQHRAGQSGREGGDVLSDHSRTAETIKQALTRLGYTAVRAKTEDGSLQGMRIYRDGRPVHETRFANVDYAIELIEAGGGFIQEEATQ